MFATLVIVDQFHAGYKCWQYRVTRSRWFAGHNQVQEHETVIQTDISERCVSMENRACAAQKYVGVMSHRFTALGSPKSNDPYKPYRKAYQRPYRKPYPVKKKLTFEQKAVS